MIDKILELYHDRVVNIVQPNLDHFMARLFDMDGKWYIRYGKDSFSIAGRIEKLTITAETERLFITVKENLA